MFGQREAKTVAMPAMAHKRKVGMLQGGGVAFVHPEHGEECVVLENGQCAFSVHSKKQKEAHVYFYVLSAELPEGARENPKTWDDTKGIAHKRSAAVRALIARPLPRLSKEFAPTPATRLARFRRHPAFFELNDFVHEKPTSGFAAKLYCAAPALHEAARKAARRIMKDMARDGGTAAAAVTMRTLVVQLAMLADCARGSLARHRARVLDEDEPAGSARTLDVFLDDNGALYFEHLLALCGFKADALGVWAPACEDATERLLGQHAHPTGVNPLRRAWAFPPRGGARVARTCMGAVRQDAARQDAAARQPVRHERPRGLRGGRGRARPGCARQGWPHVPGVGAPAGHRAQMDRAEGRAAAGARPNPPRERESAL